MKKKILLATLALAATMSAKAQYVGELNEDAYFTLSYVNKEWVTEFEDGTQHENFWGEPDKRLHGFQLGAFYQPTMTLGPGLRVGLCYEMYTSMSVDSDSPVVERGVALHKIIRLATVATAGDGYLTFMGNEFGHPEWIDFPREGNGDSFQHARRQWSLSEPDYLRYSYLRNFDEAMIHLARKTGFLSHRPELLVADEEKKLLIFKRKNLIFAVNFNPTDSFSDYGVAAPAGRYSLVLDSDAVRFNGFGRLKESEVHFTVPEKSANGPHDYNDTLYLYLPSRTAVVFSID